jgi:hypothetical protein
LAEVQRAIDGELNSQFFKNKSVICLLPEHLGKRAQAAVPVLLARVEKHPRFKHNTWAI